MLYNFVADGFHTKKLCSRLSSSEVLFQMETTVLRFEPAFRGLGATYDVYRRLIGKRVVDFIIITFCRRTQTRKPLYLKNIL